jgi:CRP/FNR family cyclic AMP-dependent transcriptional regulator
MSQLFPPGALPELDTLAAAVRRNKIGDARRLTRANWHALSKVMQRRTAEPHTCLIRQGENERRVYFVESGLLRVFRSEALDRVQIGVIGAGSLVGEGAFFAPVVRNSSVEAIEPSVLWELSTEAFEAMAEHHPEHALAFALYLGAVLSGRMLRPAARLSVT